MANLDTGSPQHWWQILSSGSAELPFRAYYEELQPVHPGEEVEMPSAVDVEILLRARIVEPLPGWSRRGEHGCGAETELLEDWSDQVMLEGEWGEDGELVEEWFEAGDSQRCATDLVVEEPEVRWERALRWVRSLYDRSRCSGEPTGQCRGERSGDRARRASGMRHSNGHLSRPQTQE